MNTSVCDINCGAFVFLGLKPQQTACDRWQNCKLFRNVSHVITKATKVDKTSVDFVFREGAFQGSFSKVHIPVKCIDWLELHSPLGGFSLCTSALSHCHQIKRTVELTSSDEI